LGAGAFEGQSSALEGIHYTAMSLGGGSLLSFSGDL
jgi:hypothetical protein